MKYTLTLNEKQIRLIADALEQHSRMICGQLNTNYIPALEHSMLRELSNRDLYLKNRTKINEHLSEIQKLAFNETLKGAHHGIGWDKEILHTFKIEDDKKKIKIGDKPTSNVHSDRPRKLTNEPKVKIEIITDRELKLKRIINK